MVCIFQLRTTISQASATDAHRLALATAPLNEGVSEQITGIIPRKSINEIGKIVSDSSENILLQLTPNSINVNVAGTYFF
jgi:DNA polymerase-3 subunit beta